jgi:hypothetical protein
MTRIVSFRRMEDGTRGNANQFTKGDPALEHVAVAQIACSAAPERV